MLAIGGDREGKRSYTFDEIILVPGTLTLDTSDVDISCQIKDLKLELPILAAAMDAIVDTKLAIELSQIGGLAILNLEGLYTRYNSVQEPLQEILLSTDQEVIQVMQRIYNEPIKDELVYSRVKEVKSAGATLAVACTPSHVERFIDIILEAGADVFVVQSTVTTLRHYSSRYLPLDFYKLRNQVPIPLLVGNCVSAAAAYELMETGIDGILVGVGPGAACTTRRVLGIGMGQATAICEVATARQKFYQKNNKYVAVIADGGIRTAADLIKAIACGSDAVVLGSILACAEEAPGKGYNWGMATPHPELPRGSRIYNSKAIVPLRQLLLGPAKVDDGTQNLLGALKLAMATCGAKTIQEFHKAEIAIVAPTHKEGKI